MKKINVLIFIITIALCGGCSGKNDTNDINETKSNEEITSSEQKNDVLNEVDVTDNMTDTITDGATDATANEPFNDVATEADITQASTDESSTVNENQDNIYGITGYGDEALQQWHDLQEEEAYELIRGALLGEEIFYYYGDISGYNAGNMDMKTLLETVFENKADMDTWKLVFVDLDGQDGIKECVLRCKDSERHYNIIFHYFAGEIYASELPYRDATYIYANGITEGEGGAGSTYWNRIYFEWGEKAVHINEAGWYYGNNHVTSLDPFDMEAVPFGSRTEAWITVDGVLYEVPGDVCSAWMKENNFPGEKAQEYDFSEENIRKYIVK